MRSRCRHSLDLQSDSDLLERRIAPDHRHILVGLVAKMHVGIVSARRETPHLHVAGRMHGHWIGLMRLLTIRSDNTISAGP